MDHKESPGPDLEGGQARLGRRDLALLRQELKGRAEIHPRHSSVVDETRKETAVGWWLLIADGVRTADTGR